MSLRRIVLLAACSLLLLHAAHFFNLVDDAYISYRYAENVAAGHGLVFNPGERVEGYTDFLWVVLLALCRLAGAPPPLASQVLGVVLTGASLLLAAAMASRLAAAETGAPPGAAPATGGIAALLLAASPAVARWAVGGLEAPLFSFLVILGAWGYLRDEESGSFPWRWPAALLLASLTRPDGVLLFLVTFLYALYAAMSHGLGVRRPVGALALYVLLGTPYFLWRVWYFGAWLPNTYSAKVVYDSFVLGHGIFYLNYFLWTSGGIVILLGAFVALWRGAAGTRLLFLLAAAYTGYVVLVGGDGEPYSRFLAPVAVLLAPAAEIGYRRLAGLVTARGAAPALRSLVPAAGAALLCLLSATGSFYGRHHDEYLKGVEGQSRRIAIGEWLRANAAPDAVVALNPVGIIPYLSGLRTIDMLGLTDAHIGREGKTVSNRVLFAHNRFDPEYVLARRPDYLIPGQASTLEVREPLVALRRPGPSTFGTVAPAFERYFDAFPGDAVLWNLPAFRMYYVPTIVETGGRFFYIFVRDRRVEESEARSDATGLTRLLAEKGAMEGVAGSGTAAARAPVGGPADPGVSSGDPVMQALRQAEADRARGDLAAALQNLQAGLGIAPKQPLLLFNLGSVYEEMSRPDEALDAYVKAVEARPDFADACNNAGTIYARRGDLASARRFWERAVAIEPKHAAAANLERLDELEKSSGRKP